MVFAAAAFHGIRYRLTVLELNMTKKLCVGDGLQLSHNNIQEAKLPKEDSHLIPDRAIHGNAIHDNFDRRQILYLRIQHAGLSALSYCWSLLLMLVAMTYNPALFVALLIGYAVGDFIFFSKMAQQGSSATGKSAAASSVAYKYSYECH